MGRLSSGTPTTFKVSGSFTVKKFDHNRQLLEEVSTNELITQSGAGTTDGVTLGRIESANPELIPAGYQDGKFSNVFSPTILNAGNTIELMVGMATCGIAAGARETLKVLMDEVQAHNLQDVKIVQVGCLGFCHSEPTVQLNMPNQEPVLYGNVDEVTAKEIVENHILNGKMVDNHILIKSFNKA